MSKSLEIRTEYSEEFAKPINAVYVDGILFDYAIDEESLWKAKMYCSNNPDLKKSVHGDIQKHFLMCFSEFVQKQVTLSDFLLAVKKGEI